MIVFDTNAVRGMSPTGSVAAMLTAIASDAGQELAISAVTEDEYRSARRREYDRRLETTLGLLKSLRKLMPTWQPPDLHLPPVDEFLGIDLEHVMKMFRVLPLDGQHAIEALKREADRKLPASQVAEPGTGARDVAIWLTAIEQSASSGTSPHY